MPKIIFLLLLLLLVSVMATVEAQAQPAAAGGPADEAPSGVGIKVSFRPSVAIVVGIFTMIFSLTFLLLMYAKFCHNSSSPPLLPTTNSPGRATTADAVQASAEPTGVGKAVIESLPFFRFAALRGARQGLECAVCLARFDDADLLRLLPRCRHAFHLDCVDRWLGSSASCPLCRARVHADDADLGLKYAAASARFVFGATGDDPAAATDAAAVAASGSGRDLMAGIFVERVPSSRFGVGCDNSNDLDRHRHRIVVSDAVFKSRWSDLNSADLLALDTEMLRSFSSGRFEYGGGVEFLPAKQLEEGHPAVSRDDGGGRTVEKTRLLESMEAGLQASSSSALIRGVRSMSEIVRLPRVARPAARTEEERRWVPIARRTARWFARREEETAEHVHVRASSSSSRV
jgi:E3 ubiquitin-protein ligase ATL6/9/15/31/42/55